MYVFDCEVFKYDWLFVFKKVGTDNYDVIINGENCESASPVRLESILKKYL